MAPTISDEILTHVRRRLSLFKLGAPSRPILVAVSGGADSVALARALVELDVPIAIAHLDHGLRAESADDAAFVEALARDLSAPFYLERADVRAEAAATGESLEMAGRGLRYTFFCRVAREHNYAAVATAHHAQDVAETVLLRVMRGAGPSGLAGIPPETEREGVRIVRPLYDVGREAIRGYLRERGQPWREDATNATFDAQRNRVRNELLPYLQEHFNPAIIDALAGAAALHGEQRDLAKQLTEDWAKRYWTELHALDRRAFRWAHTALQRDIVMAFCWAHGAEPGLAQNEIARQFILDGSTGARCDVCNGLILENTPTHTYAITPATADESVEVALTVPGIAHVNGHRVTARVLDAAPADVDCAAYCTPTRQVFDAAALAGGLTVRTRRPGDRIALLGLEGSKKLTDYLSERHVPRHLRDRQLLLARGDAILWVIGAGIAESAAITKNTEKVVEIAIHE